MELQKAAILAGYKGVSGLTEEEKRAYKGLGFVFDNIKQVTSNTIKTKMPFLQNMHNFRKNYTKDESCKIAEEKAKNNAIIKSLGETASSETFSSCSQIDGEYSCERNKFSLLELNGDLTESKILKTTILNKPRFIIFDDVELFNNNSLNALLKILEEPSKNNHFVLINNLSNPLIDTIKSRCLEIKILLNEKKRQNIIKFLIEKFKIQLAIDPQSSYLTPGNFIKFNYILKEFDILIDQDFLKNLGILLTLYKKEKIIIFIDLIFLLSGLTPFSSDQRPPSTVM